MLPKPGFSHYGSLPFLHQILRPDYTGRNSIWLAQKIPVFNFCYRHSIHRVDFNGRQVHLQKFHSIRGITLFNKDLSNPMRDIWLFSDIQPHNSQVILLSTYTNNVNISLSKLLQCILSEYKMLFLKNTPKMEKHLWIHMEVRWGRKIGPKGSKITWIVF